MKKIILAAIGAVLIAAGIVFLVLPGPGLLMIFAGLSLVAPKLAERVKRRVLRKFSKRELVYLLKWQGTGVHAGFTTRHFPLFITKTDDLLISGNQEAFRKEIFENRIAAAHGMKPVSRFVLLNQVHGDRVAVLEEGDGTLGEGFNHLKETDGILTNHKGLMLLVLTADCLPIFLRAPGWAGLVHAGWQGTRARIAKKAYELLKEKAACRASAIQVIFGPRIGWEHYEVGPEFKSYFRRRALRRRKRKLFFDLAGENRRQLRGAGLPVLNLIELDLCTVRDNSDCYSYRKEGNAAGRMVSFIVL